MSISMVFLEVEVSLPHSASIPTTPRATQPILGDPMPSFLQNFILPPSDREYPYHMHTGRIEDLQTNAFTYANNAITIASLLISYLASGSAINNTC